MADFIGIHYPNGSVEGVQMFVWDGSKPVLWDGAFSGTITIGAISGNKTNNNAAPSTDNIGVLPAIANASVPTWTEGRQVLLSTDLSGNTRVIVSAGNALIGKVGIDQTTPGTTNAVAPISGQAGVAGNTGVVGATTQRVVLATDIGLPAGTSLLGRVSASDETNTIYNGTTALTPKFAKISTSTSGASEVVAAVSSKKIRVTQVVLMSNGTVNVKFQSHVTPTDLTGLLYLVANTGFAPGYDPTGHFETVSGEALDINLSGTIAVGGWIKYIEV